MIRVALVGLGAIARYYTAALASNPSVQLVAVCDTDERKLRPFSHHGLSTSTDYRTLIEEATIDAVLVTSPNHLHAPMCNTAITAGKHVCCEKPLVLDPQEARSLTESARHADRILFTAFHRRYNRNICRLREELARCQEQGEQVAACRVRYFEEIEEHCEGDRWYLDPARCGGGVLADNGPNVFDVVDALLGPASVNSARLERDRNGVDRRAAVELTTESGIPVTCDLDWAYAGELKDVEIELVTGPRLHADMLAGFPVFKSSLVHEYERIVTDFLRAVQGESHEGHKGAEAVSLVSDSYCIARDVSDDTAIDARRT